MNAIVSIVGESAPKKLLKTEQRDFEYLESLVPTLDYLVGIDRSREIQDIQDLLHIAFEAVGIEDGAEFLEPKYLLPMYWIFSIFGTPNTWIPPYDGFSEYTIIDPWRPGRTFEFMWHTTVPSRSLRVLPWVPSLSKLINYLLPPLINNLFWQPTTILQRPDHNGNYNIFPDESWFFINGITTNDSVAQINAGYLAHLFHRPVTLIQNSTQSFFIDLLQCAIGKQSDRFTEPAIKAFPPIYEALKDEKKKKVVVIAHSQGTIIASNVLEWLKIKVQGGAEPQPPVIRTKDLGNAVAVAPQVPYVPAEPVFVYPDYEDLTLSDFPSLSVEELSKLEVYCFANCANTMTYLRKAGPDPDNQPVPIIENFGNERDIVARLGMLALHASRWHIEIDGPRYMKRCTWGHLLDEHYLSSIEKYQKDGRKPGGNGTSTPYELINPEEFPNYPAPRLFSYINGGMAA